MACNYMSPWQLIIDRRPPSPCTAGATDAAENGFEYALVVVRYDVRADDRDECMFIRTRKRCVRVGVPRVLRIANRTGIAAVLPR